MPDLLIRAAPETWDDAARTVDVLLSTGSERQLRDGRGTYVERLDLGGVNLSTLVGLPVLDSHKRGSTLDVLGTVVEAHFEGANLMGRIQFIEGSDVAPYIARVRSGAVRLSIGYGESNVRETVEDGRRVRTFTPVIREVSIVAIPADRGAKVRSRPMSGEDIEVEVTPTEGVEAAKIRSLAELAKKPDQWAEDLITRGLGVDDARALIHAEAMEAAKTAPKIRTASVGTDHTDPNEIRRRAEGALVARMEGSEVPEESREFAGMSLSDLAAHLLIARGERVRHGESPETILTRAAQHTTSDFPNLLTSAGNRVIQNAYTAAQSPLVGLCRQATLPDFRAKTALRLGEVSTLSKITESGEIKSVSRSEAAEGYALDSYAAMFSLSRKAIVNDDFGAFGDWGRAAGQAAANTEAALVWSLLSAASGAGPLMGEDGKRLFSATHGNLMTGAALSIDSLGAARLVLRTRKGLDGVTPIQVKPTTLLVGPTLETAAEKVLADISAASVDNVNPFGGALALAVEPRIEDGQWFVFSDLPTIEIGHLASAPGPQVSTRDGWEVLGREFRVVLDVGAGAVDWRGAVRNPGA